MPNFATFRNYCCFCFKTVKMGSPAVCIQHEKLVAKKFKYVGFIRPVEHLNADCVLETKYEWKIEENKKTKRNYKKVS